MSAARMNQDTGAQFVRVANPAPETLTLTLTLTEAEYLLLATGIDGAQSVSGMQARSSIIARRRSPSVLSTARTHPLRCCRGLPGFGPMEVSGSDPEHQAGKDPARCQGQAGHERCHGPARSVPPTLVRPGSRMSWASSSGRASHRRSRAAGITARGRAWRVSRKSGRSAPCGRNGRGGKVTKRG